MTRRDLIKLGLALPAAIIGMTVRRGERLPELGLSELEGQVVSLEYPMARRISRHEDTVLAEPVLTSRRMTASEVRMRLAQMTADPRLVWYE